MENNFISDMKKEEEMIISKFNEETAKKLKIIDILNSLYCIILNEYYTKLEIHEDEKLIIFELAKAKIYFLDNH